MRLKLGWVELGCSRVGVLTIKASKFWEVLLHSFLFPHSSPARCWQELQHWELFCQPAENIIIITKHEWKDDGVLTFLALIFWHKLRRFSRCAVMRLTDINDLSNFSYSAGLKLFIWILAFLSTCLPTSLPTCLYTYLSLSCLPIYPFLPVEL